MRAAVDRAAVLNATTLTSLPRVGIFSHWNRSNSLTIPFLARSCCLRYQGWEQTPSALHTHHQTPSSWLSFWNACFYLADFSRSTKRFWRTKPQKNYYRLNNKARINERKHQDPWSRRYREACCCNLSWNCRSHWISSSLTGRWCLVLLLAIHTHRSSCSILEMAVDERICIAHDATGSRVFDSFLESPTVSSKMKRKLVMDFIGHYYNLVDDKFGSRVGDRCWAFTDTYLKVCNPLLLFHFSVHSISLFVSRKRLRALWYPMNRSLLRLSMGSSFSEIWISIYFNVNLMFGETFNPNRGILNNLLASCLLNPWNNHWKPLPPIENGKVGMKMKLMHYSMKNWGRKLRRLLCYLMFLLSRCKWRTRIQNRF